MLDNALKILAGILAVSAGIITLRAQIRKRSRASQEIDVNAPKSSTVKAFEPLINLVTVLGMMIAFPLALYLFGILLNGYAHAFDRPATTSAPTPSFLQKQNSTSLSEIEKRYYSVIDAANLIPNDNSSKNNILEEVSNLAMTSGYYRVAIDAAKNVSNNNLLENQLLVRIMARLSSSNDGPLSLEAITSIANDNSLQTREITEFSEKVLNSLRTVQLTK